MGAETAEALRAALVTNAESNRLLADAITGVVSLLPSVLVVIAAGVGLAFGRVAGGAVS